MGIIQDFKAFALRGNLVELAIGFTVGAAFTAVARSLVDDIIMPFVNLALAGVEVSDLFIVLRPGAEGPPYASLAAAQAAGAVTLNYGAFMNTILTFIIVALAMFLMIRMVSRLEKQIEAELDGSQTGKEAPAMKACPYCKSTININAVRCPQCTSGLEAAANGAGDIKTPAVPPTP